MATRTAPRPTVTAGPLPERPSATPVQTDPLPTPRPTPTIPVLQAADPQAYGLQRIVEGLDQPVYVTFAPDGSGRLFIVEQTGKIRIWQAGGLLPTPFLDLTGVAVNSGMERGLLGLAFSPAYVVDGRVFVNYTDANGDTAIVRYTVSAADPNQADPASAHVLLHITQPYANHNGGDLAFGPDGRLYVGMGDGGSAGDPLGNGQNLDSLLGKMLRLEVHGDTVEVPADNPFADRGGSAGLVWALGLRNPWRFSFDRVTGALFIADVGQNSYEEIDYQPAGDPGGQNYGWNLYEGRHPYAGNSTEGLTLPIAEYTHAEGGCAVTGGYVYRGTRLPGLTGQYVFGDYCTGKTWTLYWAGTEWIRTDFLSTGLLLSSFGEDEAGEVYLVDHRGAVYQLVAAP